MTKQIQNVRHFYKINILDSSTLQKYHHETQKQVKGTLLYSKETK